MPHDDHSHSLLPSDPALRVKALETLLVEKGLVDPAALDEIIDTYSHKIGPQNGAKVVAKAWVDPDFRAALFADATSAVRDLGYYGRQGRTYGRGGKFRNHAQLGRLHIVQLLSMAIAGHSARLVQI